MLNRKVITLIFFFCTIGRTSGQESVQNTFSEMDSAIVSGKYGEIHSVIVWEKGKIFFENYYNGWDQDSLHQLQSATKSVIATLLGIALKKGFVKSVKDPISNYLKEVPDDKRSMTIEDLLCQKHGLRWNEGAWDDPDNSWRKLINEGGDWSRAILALPMDTIPGTKFNYSNAAPTLVSCIIQEASGLTIDSFAKKYLFTPLQINKYWFWQGNGGPSKNGMALISLKSIDMLKIGQLYLDDGLWGDEQILTKEFVQQATADQVKKVGENGVFFHYNYGYFWWSNPLYRLSKNKRTSDVFLARGAGGQNIIVDRKKKKIVIITAWNLQRSNWPQAIYHDYLEE